VADEYRFAAPRIAFIPDRNPTAFTYGLLRSNARIVVTQGIFEFLSEDEQRAVVAHELGHILNRDFMLMTMAGMLVQILYQVYAALMRSSGGSSDKKGKGAIIGLAALLCYYIGIYLLLYLSRTREYLADAFSASRVEPRHLATALIKIAYGIVAVEDTEATQSLLRSTRHLGVIGRPRTPAIPASSPRVRPRAPAAPPRPCCSTRIIPGRRSFSSTRRTR
jgi:Zn-dependent protease with chaperone function